MNDSLATNPLADPTTAITTIHLVLIAILAVAAIGVILWGMKLKRRRSAGDDLREEHQAEVAAATPAPTELNPALDVPTPASAPITSKPGAHTTPQQPAADRLGDVPVAAAFEANPVTEPSLGAEPEVTLGPPPGEAPVTALKGLGPKVAARLAELGVTTVGELGRLDPAQAQALDVQLGPFTGRMARDRWIEQARLLASGNVKGFEAVFGKL